MSQRKWKDRLSLGHKELQVGQKELQERQDKIFELLTKVSDRVSEPLDEIEALSKRVWNTEKDISKLQRSTGLK